MHKKFALLHLVGAFFCLSVFAEPDNGKFFPNAEPLLPNHIFLEAGGGLNFPVEFFNQGTIAMTSYGGNIFGGLGYNLSGWLSSITYTHDMWGEGKGDYALMENFRNNIFELRLRKIISKKTIRWFPSMLEMIPGIGLGINLITTDYYPSRRAKSEGKLYSVKFASDGAICFFYRTGLEFALNGITDMFIPFIGADYNAFYDTSIGGGFAGFARIYAGVRMYPFGIVNDIQRIKEERREKLIASWPEPSASISVNPESDFTPDEDDVNDIAVLQLRTEYLEADPQSWEVSICDPKGLEIKKWSGKGKLPNQLEWNGKADNGELVFSRNTYSAKLKVIPSAQDIERTGKAELTSSLVIKTGILFQVVIPNKQWKIIVNTIYFDPDRETFEKITEEQKRENIETLESITRQIRAHGDVDIIVEGYANNVSNTERENINELIPLSKLRAKTIMNHLIENGLDKSQLSFAGKGGQNPIAKWEDRENWWKNRRVEFVVTKRE